MEITIYHNKFKGTIVRAIWPSHFYIEINPN